MAKKRATLSRKARKENQQLLNFNLKKDLLFFAAWRLSAKILLPF
jgi:hypothetical protein